MTELEKAARQALAVLEAKDTWGASIREAKENAITALRRALEQQPAEEPVATLWQHGETGRTRVTMPGDITDCDASWFKAADLYTRPQPAAWVGLTADDVWQSNEVMALNAEMGLTMFQIMALMFWANAKLREKNAQPAAQWVGLTDEEIALVCAECAASAHRHDDISYARAIEAKLKEKNT